MDYYRPDVTGVNWYDTDKVSVGGGRKIDSSRNPNDYIKEGLKTFKGFRNEPFGFN